VELAHQGSFPIVPCLVVGSVRIDEGKEMECFHRMYVSHCSGKISNSIGVANVFGGGCSPESEVVINEEHDQPEAVTGIAKAFTDFCGENCAGIFVMSNFLSTTGVVH
jgi:hypothetical protein